MTLLRNLAELFGKHECRCSSCKAHRAAQALASRRLEKQKQRQTQSQMTARLRAEQAAGWPGAEVRG